jgi:hypothetical protein
MLWICLLFLSTAAIAKDKPYNDKPFYGVSESNVLKARCIRSNPFTENEMMDWLYTQSQQSAQNNSTQSDTRNVHGIELTNESPYLIQLLDALLTNETWSSIPQKTYSSPCKTVYCAATELFGRKTGIQLLYMLGRFGFNGSHLRIKNADLWRSDELDTVLLALSDLPQHLIPKSPIAYNHQLAHSKRSESGTSKKGQLLGNAMIFLFDGWSDQSQAIQRYTVFHELGHDLGSTLELSESSSWYRVAGWKELEFDWNLSHPEKTISQYAETNPYEDFAESFAAYRYNPETLKGINPGVYKFFKNKVYQSNEYIANSPCEAI